MKLEQKEIKAILYLLGLVMVVLLFQFVYTPKQEENLGLSNQVAQLESEIALLQTKVAREEEYRSGTETLAEKTEDVLDKFPSNLREEDGIMYVAKLESGTGVKVSNVGLSQASVVYDMSGNTPATGEGTQGTEGTELQSTAEPTGRVLYNIPITFNYTATYSELKECVDYIHSGAERKSLESISLSYDSKTGKIIGNLMLNNFFITGTDVSYTAPIIPGMSTGSNNIFGTVEKVKETP